MPLIPEQQKPVQSNNQPSLLRRLYGGIIGNPMSEQTEQEYPDLARSWAGRQNEAPGLAANVTNVKPMGIFDRYMSSGSGAYASTGPMGGISMNMGAIARDKQNVDDVLSHEMTHAGQGLMGYLKGKFGTSKMRNQIENEAINKESLRPVRRDNIFLR